MQATLKKEQAHELVTIVFESIAADPTLTYTLQLGVQTHPQQGLAPKDIKEQIKALLAFIDRSSDDTTLTIDMQFGVEHPQTQAIQRKIQAKAQAIASRRQAEAQALTRVNRFPVAQERVPELASTDGGTQAGTSGAEPDSVRSMPGDDAGASQGSGQAA